MTSPLANIYARLPVSFTHGQGVWLWDAQGLPGRAGGQRRLLSEPRPSPAGRRGTRWSRNTCWTTWAAT